MLILIRRGGGTKDLYLFQTQSGIEPKTSCIAWLFDMSLIYP